MNGSSSSIRSILDGALRDGEISLAHGMSLGEATGGDLHALCAAAAELRVRQAGEAVTYVVNRNINFTNVCVKTCTFCAFSRDLRSEQGYMLDEDEIVRRALEAQAYGATEICLQAGLAPTVTGNDYVRLCRTIKGIAPGLHIHAFSPEEIKYGALKSRRSVGDLLSELKEAGLGSLPGTSAEILDDRIRSRIAPGRITTAQWIDVVRTAHGLGIPTTSTIMFGHVETWPDRIRHLDLLRSLQRETGGFTEFVPLSFVHAEAPLFAQRLDPSVRGAPEEEDIVRFFAVARLMLGKSFRNIQVSWVKEGVDRAARILRAGANDLGGTLINESISTSAGAAHGQRMTPADLRSLIRKAGRHPKQRTTLYGTVKAFDLEPREGEGADEALNGVIDPEATFGSYAALVANERYRYRFGSVPHAAVAAR